MLLCWFQPQPDFKKSGWHLPRMINEVISYWSINIWSWSGNTVVHINSQRKVVKDDGGDLKIKRITQIIRVRSFPEIPVICENREAIKNVTILYAMVKKKKSQCNHTSHEVQMKVYLVLGWGNGHWGDPVGMQRNAAQSILPVETTQELIKYIKYQTRSKENEAQKAS